MPSRSCFAACFMILVLPFLTCCQSSLLESFDESDGYAKDKSVLSLLNCESLKKKAEDLSFSLRNLAAIRASARCKNFTFDINQLSDFERQLYATELNALDSTKMEDKQDLSINELKEHIKKEPIATRKFKFYRQLYAKYRRDSNRRNYIKTAYSTYKWALENYHINSHVDTGTNKDNAAILYEAAQLAARTYWTEDNINLSLKIINKSMRELKKESVAELLLLKGLILEEIKKPTEALTLYDLVIEDMQKYSPKNLSFNMDRILWCKAWLLYKNKNYAEAAEAFAKLANTTVELSERSRSQFYQARSLKHLGQGEMAKIIFESITQNDFFGYYGLVSYHELGKRLPALSNIKQPDNLKFDLTLKFLKSTERSIFRDLISYKEDNLSEKATSLLAKSKTEEINLGLYLAKKSQLYLPLFRAFSKLDNDEKIDVFVNYPDLIFPQPYQNYVNEMAAKTNLPRSLIYAIIKQESAFNERARSAADAIGLMQVIPKLARHLSRKFEVPYRNSHDLFNPIINIQLGSFELMEQVKKQKGQLTYVAAAYNAGPGALANWLKNRKRDDILEFIEEIPYSETKNYVKLIARNKLFYERISNRDSEHDFPVNFLN